MGYITVWCAGVATSGNAIVMSYCCDFDLPKVGRLVDALVVCESMLIFSFKNSSSHSAHLRSSVCAQIKKVKILLSIFKRNVACQKVTEVSLPYLVHD